MKIRMIASLGAALLIATVATPALAAPGDSGQGNGGCIDNLYGNATNPRPGGHGVLPSQSPGPWVNTGFNDPPRNDRTRGPSVGDVMQAVMELAPEANGSEIHDLICTFP